MDKEKIIKEFEDNLATYFIVAESQRSEIYNSFLYMNNHRVDGEPEYTGLGKADRFNPPNKRKTNISMLPAIVRGVSGSGVMQERHIDIVPIDDPEYDVEADVMDDGVEWCQYASDWKPAYDKAKHDSAVCGIGATVTYLDMTKKEVASGTPTVKRIYPGYTFYDNSGRGQDLNATARWCGYVDPMRMTDLEEYVKKKIGKEFDGKAGASIYTDQFLDGRGETDVEIDMLYHYFWWDYETIYDVTNPINTDEDFAAAMNENDIAVEFMGAWAAKVRVDLQAPYWTLSKDEFKDLQETMEAITRITGEEYEIKKSERETKCFYRAEFAMGYLLSYSKSYSQNEFPLTFFTGYFDDAMGIYYGFVRPLSFIQDALNQVMDDLLEYSHASVTGGKAWIKGGLDDLKLIKQSKANEDDVTPIPASAEIISKSLGTAPQILLETARLMIELMPRAIGIGQEFLGVITSGTMTDSLFGKVVKQSFAVLADWGVNSAKAVKKQGRLFIDLTTSIAEVENGREVPYLSPERKEESTFRLYQQNMARQYAIRIQERPVSDDDRMENMKALMQLVGVVPQVDAILPAIIENMRLDYGMRKQITEAITPKATPPDPMNVAMVEANIRLLNAQAGKLEADAAEKGATVPMQPDVVQSEINKNVASAIKSMADAGAIKTDVAMQIMNAINGVTNDRRNQAA